MAIFRTSALVTFSKIGLVSHEVFVGGEHCQSFVTSLATSSLSREVAVSMFWPLQPICVRETDVMQSMKKLSVSVDFPLLLFYDD